MDNLFCSLLVLILIIILGIISYKYILYGPAAWRNAKKIKQLRNMQYNTNSKLYKPRPWFDII